VSHVAEAVAPAEAELWDSDFPDAAAAKSLSVRPHIAFNFDALFFVFV
jgi:hypothetical protein